MLTLDIYRDAIGPASSTPVFESGGQTGVPEVVHVNFDIPSIPEAGYFAVDFERRGQVLYVIPKGELDMGSAQKMSDALAAAEDEGSISTVVDMALVSFLDCSGLSVVVGAYNRALRDDQKLEIVNVQPTVRRIFVLTGFKHMLSGTPLQEPESIGATAEPIRIT